MKVFIYKKDKDNRLIRSLTDVYKIHHNEKKKLLYVYSKNHEPVVCNTKEFKTVIYQN